MIGFEKYIDYVPENITNGVKLLCVKVLEGNLTRETTVIVQYYDITSTYYNYIAVGKCNL